jgi:hypothetical protein
LPGHPTRGPEVDPGEKTYRERWFEAEAKVTDEVSTHTFTWARDLVRFASYEGVDYPSPRVIAQWEYSGKQPVRRAKEGLKTSNPVGIPRPGRETKARLNLWLADLNGDGAGDAPSDGKDIEVIIEKFEFFRSK